MVQCSSCGADNQTGALFCEMCGTQLAGAAAPPAQSTPVSSATGATVTCPTCGTPAIPGEAFCDNCGTSLSMSSASAPPAAPQPLPAPPAQPAPQPVYPPPQPIAATPAASCPNCGTPAIPGEAFCDSCGASLGSGAGAVAGSAAQPAAAPAPPAVAPAAPASIPPVPPPSTAVTSLQGMTLDFSGSQIPLPAKQEVILGRQDPVSGHFPDVDLMPYGAFEGGVGRRHARIMLRGGQVLIEDLDSTNGTLVNKQRLRPRQPVQLNGGEEIRLGKLVFTFKTGAA